MQQKSLREKEESKLVNTKEIMEMGERCKQREQKALDAKKRDDLFNLKILETTKEQRAKEKAEHQTMAKELPWFARMRDQEDELLAKKRAIEEKK